MPARRLVVGGGKRARFIRHTEFISAPHTLSR